MKVTVDSAIRLDGVTPEDMRVIERDLTFENPKYKQVLKYSKWGSNTRVPQYIEYFRFKKQDGVMTAVVPRGYDFITRLPSAHQDGVPFTDGRVCPHVRFPEFLYTLRDAQKAAKDSYLEKNVDSDVCYGSIQLPTGKGKTILGLSIAAALQTRTLIIVHKTDLVNGWLKSIKNVFGGKAAVGVIQAQSKQLGKHFTIATVQTLNRLDEKHLDILYNHFGLVIQDEMHHCPSTSFSLADNFKSMYRLGLTATPERSDGLAHVMNLYYGDFCYRYVPSDDEPEEDILGVKVIKKNVPTYFDPVLTKKRGGYILPSDLDAERHFNRTFQLNGSQVRMSHVDYNSRPQLTYMSVDNAVVSRQSTIDFVVQDIINEYGKGHSCIAFFTRTESVELYRDALLEWGVPDSDIGLYYGGNPDCESVRKKAEKQRKFITLATYSKATEGTDVVQWEVCFLVSSINNGKNTEQAVGRVRRKVAGVKKLSTALLYDYRYPDSIQLSNHGRTRDERYRKLGFEQESTSAPKQRLFGRGFVKK